MHSGDKDSREQGGATEKKNIEMNNMEKATERTSETGRPKGMSKEEVKRMKMHMQKKNKLMSKDKLS